MNELQLALLLTGGGLVAGGIISYLLGRFFKSEKRLAHTMVSNTYLDLTSDDSGGRLKVTYDNEVILNLQRTFCLFWNPSDVPIRREDISDRQPLRLSFPKGSKILELRRRPFSRESVEEKYLAKENTVEINFALLNQGDYASVEVYWTEPTETEDHVGPICRMDGVIAGMNLQFEEYPFHQVLYDKPPINFSPLVTTLIAALCGGMIFGLISAAPQFSNPWLIYALAILSGILAMILLGVSQTLREYCLVWYRRRMVFPRIKERFKE